MLSRVVIEMYYCSVNDKGLQLVSKILATIRHTHQIGNACL